MIGSKIDITTGLRYALIGSKVANGNLPVNSKLSALRRSGCSRFEPRFAIYAAFCPPGLNRRWKQTAMYCRHCLRTKY